MSALVNGLLGVLSQVSAGGEARRIGRPGRDPSRLQYGGTARPGPPGVRGGRHSGLRVPTRSAQLNEGRGVECAAPADEGGTVPDSVTTACEQSNAIDQVRVTGNLGYTLLTVVTLGFWSPMQLQWHCAKAVEPPGTIDLSPTPPDTGGGR